MLKVCKYKRLRISIKIINYLEFCINVIVLSKENKILQIAKPESTVDRCLNDESECINISDTDDEENSKHQAFISNNQETKRYISADEKISKAVCIIKKDSVLEELISRNKINIESGGLFHVWLHLS